MENQLIVAFAGKKQSGKSTACNYFVAKYLFSKVKEFLPFTVNNKGELYAIYTANPIVYSSVTDQFVSYGIKVYSFADPLKRFCIDVLNAPYESCYGTDEQKNTPIPHLLWQNLPSELRPVVNNETSFGRAVGPMTGRELMQNFGTDFCRKLYNDCWVRGTYETIKKENVPVALISDCRFENELYYPREHSIKATYIKLKKAPFKNDTHKSEIGLDNVPDSDFDYVIDNENMTLQQKFEALDPIIEKLFNVVVP